MYFVDLHVKTFHVGYKLKDANLREHVKLFQTSSNCERCSYVDWPST